MKLQEWITQQTVGDEMLWKGSFGRQMMFLRDELQGLIGVGLDYPENGEIAKVISTHRSKSIVLPVVQYERPELGLRFTVRNNFYNWKLSVEAPRPVIADFEGLFHTTPPLEPDYTGNPLHAVYFEGFPEDFIFDYYWINRQKWSAEISGDKCLWTTVFLTMKALGHIQPFKWSVRPLSGPFAKK
jgi:hypothetical protein